MSTIASTPGQVALRLENATKSFGNVTALIDGQIVLEAGRIHALVGENGAGKSTLVKLLAGLYSLDSGDLFVAGNRAKFRTVAESKMAGISVIYQEPTLFPDLTVAENIFIGRQPLGALGFINKTLMSTNATELFERLGVDIDPSRLADGLSIADQQVIEIAKAISIESQVLIMDEPTAALSGAEVARLFEVARGLRDKGVALLFISHRFDEIFDLCDQVTVMRDGSFISSHKISEITAEQLVTEMVGRRVETLYPKSTSKIGDVVLEVNNLSRVGEFVNVNLEVKSGEIVGLAGLVGAGRTEIARSIFGIDRYDSGTVVFEGVVMAVGDPLQAIQSGMAFVPEDRRKQGVILDLSVKRNTTLTLRKALERFGFIPSQLEKQAAIDWTSKLRVKANSIDDKVSTLSGGNQQKVVLAKWLATEPRFLIVDEPTRGIDVGTKAEVHKLLSDLAARGIAILMISSELPEVLGMADRIYVLREGRVAAELTRDEASPELIMTAATMSRERVS